MGRHNERRCSRRQFVRSAAVSPWLALRSPATETKRDRFGGSTDIRFKATGSFRLEEKDRWWLVTPDGNAFLSFGVNHVAPQRLQLEENRAYWLEKFGSKTPEDDAFLKGFRRKVRQDLDAFGFNTLGTHNSMRWYPPGFVPYVSTCVFVEIPHFREPAEKDFLDVFSLEFEAHCDARASHVVKPNADDPYLFGHALTDCPIFTDLDAAPRENNVYGAKRRGLPTWPRVLRNLPGGHPGKKAYVLTMRTIYNDNIDALNRTYATQFDSFDALAAATNWRPANDPGNSNETRDNDKFLLQVIEQYYRVATNAIRKYDRSHLILGDKLNGNTNTPDAIVSLAGKYMDLIFYQTYGSYDEQKPQLDRWSSLTGKALLAGDSSYSVPTKDMPDPYAPHCKDQEERARRSLEFAEKGFARPDFVGWHYCGWMDGTNRLPFQQFKQHSGFQTMFGEHHKPLLEALSGFSRRMYDIAAKRTA